MKVLESYQSQNFNQSIKEPNEQNAVKSNTHLLIRSKHKSRNKTIKL